MTAAKSRFCSSLVFCQTAFGTGSEKNNPTSRRRSSCLVNSSSLIASYTLLVCEMTRLTKNSSAGVTGCFATFATGSITRGQFRGTEEFFPDLTIIGDDGQEIGYAPGFGFGIGIIPCHPALKMGIATGVVCSWESGSSQPDSHQLEVLVKFLGATLNLLLPTNNGW